MRKFIEKIFKLVLVGCIVIPLNAARPIQAENIYQEELVLVDNENLYLSSSIDQNETELNWVFDYEKKQVHFGFRVKDKNMNVVAFNENSKWVTKEDQWFEQLESEGGLIYLTTQLETEELILEIINKVTLEVTTFELNKENYLKVKDSASDVEDETPIVDTTPETEVEDKETDVEATPETEVEDKETDVDSNAGAKPEDNIQDNDSIIVIDDISKLENIKDIIFKQSGARAAQYQDLYAYTNDSIGIYPTHGTELYLIGGVDSKITKNYNYGLKNPLKPNDLAPAYGTSLTFENGYHLHPNPNPAPNSTGPGILTKKTVKPTNDPGKFEVEADIIGGASQVIQPVDVMLIIDKSASMLSTPTGGTASGTNLSRWNLLKKSVQQLANELLTNENSSLPPKDQIRLGLTSFGSTWNGSRTNDIWSEVANYGTANAPSYFTSSRTDLTNKPIFTVNPPTGSGTPTFLGVEAAMEAMRLQGRPDAKKFIILITDGIATFGPGSAYESNGINTSTITKGTDINRLRYQLGSNGNTRNLFYGDGLEGTDDESKLVVSDTIRRFNIVRAQPGHTNLNTNYVSFGLGHYPGTSGTQNEYRRQMDEILNGFSLNNPARRFDATTDEGVKKSFEMMKRIIIGSVENFVLGQFIDPMSEYVKFVDNTIKSSALSLNYNEAKKEYENISVIPQFKPDGSPNEAYPDYAKNIEMQLPKADNDDTLHLSEMNLGAEGKTRKGFRVTYTVELKEEYRDGKFYPANGPTQAIAYNYDEAVGFAVPSVRVPVTNVEFNKHNEFGKPLENVVFKLNRGTEILRTVTSDEFGKFELTNLTYGSYRLEETDPLPGYDSMEDIVFTVVQGPPIKNGILTINGLDEIKDQTGSLILINKLKDFELIVTKVDKYDSPVRDVKFKLVGENYSKELVGSGDNGNIFKFVGLKPGTYTLSETEAPSEYVKMKDVVIVIGEDGSITIDGVDSGSGITADGNIITYKAINIRKGILPSTGGSGTRFYSNVSFILIGFSGLIAVIYLAMKWIGGRRHEEIS